MWNLAIFVFSLVSVLANNDTEGDKERMDVITACWMLSIQDQAHHAIQLEKVLSMAKDRSKAMDKIQVDIVRRCFRALPLKDAENVIEALMDPQITPITLRDVLPDLEYEEFASTVYNVEFDDVDKFFYTLIQDLDKNMGKIFKGQDDRDIKIFGLNSKTLILPIILFLFALGGYTYLKGKKEPVKSRRRERKQN